MCYFICKITNKSDSTHGVLLFFVQNHRYLDSSKEALVILCAKSQINQIAYTGYCYLCVKSQIKS